MISNVDSPFWPPPDARPVLGAGEIHHVLDWAERTSFMRIRYLGAARAACHHGGMVGRLHHVILDCPDPAALAGFYSALLGLPITYTSDDFVVVAASDTSSGLAFQLAPGHQPPTWPDPAVPQQVHLDIMVEDVAAAGPRVLALGAAKLDGDDVYADPAGHPFCLIRRPGWAVPIE
jgi:catechol 2,3-dioxygenase-like lactoylglutathione lyase family enzyme